MKKIKYTVLLLVSILIIGSCNDWLYLEPENGIIRDNYWQSKEDVHAALMGCYASLLGNTSGGGYDVPYLMFMWGEMRADWIVPGRSYPTDYKNVFNGEIFPENSFCKWNSIYRTINYCNTVLKYAPTVLDNDPSFTEEQLANYEGEALAIRSLMYFYLARTFKEVPLKIDATTNDGQIFTIKKNTHNEILAQIKKDLLEAEQKVPYTYNEIEKDKARITKYSVNAIQSDVYLWTEQYNLAIDACNKIINSGVFGLLEADEFWFENLYVEGNSKEGIFELPFSITKLNPFYEIHGLDQSYRASSTTAEELFPYDASAPVDSFDIRSDGCSYKAGYNYMIWKYIGRNREELKYSNESFSNIMVYRYAEILLNKAEALNQINRGEEALELVRIIRKRSNASRISDQSSVEKTTLGAYILEERAREFAFEGKRWFDLLRNAKRNNYQRMDLILEAVSRNAPAEKQQTIINKYKDTLSHYLPIYYGEIDNNPNLEQNPFYEDKTKN